MKTYVLSPQSIERAKHKALIRGSILMAFSLALPLGILTATGLVTGLVLIFSIPLVLVSGIIGVRRGWKILDENLTSYQLIVGSDSVIKRQAKFPDIEINRVQIINVEEKSGKGLFIRTGDKKSFINVPEGLEGVDELKETLSKWLSPDSIISSKERGTILQAMALLSFGIAFAMLWLSTNLALVIAAGIFLIVYTVWSSVYLLRRRDIDARAKLKPWLILLLLFAYAMMLYGRVSFLLRR
jgi:hypothetical protein